nr:uncharacterized protein LOC105471637 isoform X2 [Macaca nemestrina]
MKQRVPGTHTGLTTTHEISDDCPHSPALQGEIKTKAIFRPKGGREEACRAHPCEERSAPSLSRDAGSTSPFWPAPDCTCLHPYGGLREVCSWPGQHSPSTAYERGRDQGPPTSSTRARKQLGLCFCRGGSCCLEHHFSPPLPGSSSSAGVQAECSAMWLTESHPHTNLRREVRYSSHFTHQEAETPETNSIRTPCIVWMINSEDQRTEATFLRQHSG